MKIVLSIKEVKTVKVTLQQTKDEQGVNFLNDMIKNKVKHITCRKEDTCYTFNVSEDVLTAICSVLYYHMSTIEEIRTDNIRLSNLPKYASLISVILADIRAKLA